MEFEPEKVFEKVHILSDGSNKNWELPAIELYSVKSHLQDKRLVELKNSLNQLKGSLNGYEIENWHKHTTYCNPSGSVNREIRHQFHPELCTQAWCKFHELLCFDEFLPEWALASRNIAAVHLCEAPGGFICSLNHFLKSRYKHVRYKWIACTLNPYYEGNDAESCVADDRLIFHTLGQWCFGSDNTGDIFSKSLLDDIRKRATAMESVCLLTADGSFNCQNDPAKQELNTARLKFTELMYCLHILSPGGSFVLKIFTPLEYTSVQLLYILVCLFGSVTVRKPATSKPGNSELYVVAKDFKGISSEHSLLAALHKSCIDDDQSPLELFSTDCLPGEFVSAYISCVEKFVKYQTDAIQQNILQFENGKKLNLDEIHKTVAAFAVEKMNIKRVPRNQCIVKNGILKTIATSNVSLRPKMFGTFVDRKVIKPVIHDAAQNLTEITWVPRNVDGRQYDHLLTYGRPLNSVRTSLFCETKDLFALHRSDSTSFEQITDYDMNEIRPITDALRSMLSNGNGQSYETELLTDGKLCRELLGQTCVDLLRCKQLNLPTANSLEKGATLFASLIKRNYEMGSVRELSTTGSLMKLVLHAMKKFNSGANLVVILPSAFTRLTAGLLHMLRATFKDFAIAAIPSSDPCLVVICSSFAHSQGYQAHLEIALRSSDERPDDACLLGLMPIHQLVEDERFVKILKKCNHMIVTAMLKSYRDFLV